MKMSHQLWNTNQQNGKFYGEDNRCPICETEIETLNHIYCCKQASAVATQQSAGETFRSVLAKTTPDILLHAIEVVMNKRTQGDPGNMQPQFPEDITKAMNDQTAIGWGSFHRGHVATAWRWAYKASIPPKQANSPRGVNKWMKKLICSL
jgi:hypothetical protein